MAHDDVDSIFRVDDFMPEADVDAVLDYDTGITDTPPYPEDLNLSDPQQKQLKQGLTVVASLGTKILADVLAEAYSDFVDQEIPKDSERYGFAYLPFSEQGLFDQIGVGLFETIKDAVGYRLRTAPGCAVEDRGFILYSSDATGTKKHSDLFYGDTLLRLSLPFIGEGNFWSTTTGSLISRPGDLLVQELNKSPQHAAGTKGFAERAVAFWDIAAERAA